jgi:type IV secretion system protein VirB1
MPLDFIALAQECAPQVAPQVMAAIVKTESGFNPYAIGVVGGRLVRQPQNFSEAVATAQALETAGWNYSVGLAQVNKKNFQGYALTLETAFDRCANLRAGARILSECHAAAKRRYGEASALARAFSCYYSGNFTRGFSPDRPGEDSYVQKVAGNLSATSVKPVRAIPVVSDKRPAKAKAAQSRVNAARRAAAYWRDVEPMMYTTTDTANSIRF